MAGAGAGAGAGQCTVAARQLLNGFNQAFFYDLPVQLNVFSFSAESSTIRDLFA